MTSNQSSSVNVGSRLALKLHKANFPNADAIVRKGLLTAPRSEDAVDILTKNDMGLR